MAMHRVLPALVLFGIVAGIALAGEETPPPPPVEPPPPAQQVEPIRQVQIQVWISETTEDGLRDIGTNLDFTRFVRGIENSGTVERISTRVFDPNSFQVTLPAADTNPYPDNVRLTPDFPASVADGSVLESGGITTQSGAGVSFSIIDSGTGTIDGIIRGIEQKADADLISKPELLVVEGQTANIHAGEEIPYQSLIYQKGRAQLQVTWRQVGVNLGIQPLVLDDDMIEINLSDEPDSGYRPAGVRHPRADGPGAGSQRPDAGNRRSVLAQHLQDGTPHPARGQAAGAGSAFPGPPG